MISHVVAAASSRHITLCCSLLGTTALLATNAFAQGLPKSDDFNGSILDTSTWTGSAPAGGAVSVSNGHALLTVPGGSNHDAFVGGNNSVRILQPVSNSDFDVAAKFDSPVNAKYEGEGILIQQDSATYLRLEVSSDGSRTSVSAALDSGGQEHSLFRKPISGVSAPVWLQVKRTGNTWALSYSTDGNNYAAAGSFSQIIVVTAVGPYAWNYNSQPGASPAFTSLVDYFYALQSTTSGPPLITTVAGTAAQTTAAITWLTDQAANSLVNYGLTASYGGSASNPALSTTHSVSLSGLTCQTTYNYDVSSTSASGQTAVTGNFTFTTAPCMVTGGGPVSDNFDGPTLNTGVWSFVNPARDGVVTMNGTGVTLNLPAGKQHDAYTPGNTALRLMQPISNVDFDVQIRFQSAVELGNQDEGILVQQDGTHFLSFDTYSDGTVTRLLATVIQDSNVQVFSNFILTLPNPAAPLWLDLRRTGNTWIGTWSTDGINFNAGANFSAALNVTAVGPYAGNANANASNSPAFTATIDYFFNTASPVPNASGPPPFGVITVDGNPASALVEKTLADIQGTGILNPVAGFEYPSGGIYWYGSASSTDLTSPWRRYTIVSSGNAYEDMIPLDVNQDGAVDIVASYASSGDNYSVVWFENPRGHGGNPQTGPWIMHVIGPGYGEDNLVTGDFDGDGRIDIANASYLYFQNNPTSWTRVQYNKSFRGIALLDIGSGKGGINLVGTAASSPFDAIWFENPRESGGNARTGAWVQHTIGASYQCSSCPDPDAAVYNAADFNRDGRIDIVMAQSEGSPNTPPPPGGLIWFEAPPDPRNGAWVRHTIDANFVDAHAVRIGDMDKNGTVDLITSEQDQSPLRRVSIFFNDGSGNFTQQVLSNVEGHNTVVGDVRHTGSLDILNSGHGYYGANHPLQIFTNPR